MSRTFGWVIPFPPPPPGDSITVSTAYLLAERYGRSDPSASLDSDEIRGRQLNGGDLDWLEGAKAATSDDEIRADLESIIGAIHKHDTIEIQLAT